MVAVALQANRYSSRMAKQINRKKEGGERKHIVVARLAAGALPVTSHCPFRYIRAHTDTHTHTRKARAC